MSLHYLKKPPYAPAFPWDSPEQVICSRYQRCRGCPYPSHGFLCWRVEWPMPPDRDAED